jgi:hypothetical protein
VPYQLAAARVTDALGARDRYGCVTTRGAGATHRAVVRLAKRGLVELERATSPQLRTFYAPRCLPVRGQASGAPGRFGEPAR